LGVNCGIGWNLGVFVAWQRIYRAGDLRLLTVFFMHEQRCAITGKAVAAEKCTPCAAIRPSLLRFIRKSRPDLLDSDCVSAEALADITAKFVEDALESELGEITDLERDVIESLRAHDVVSSHPDTALDRRNFGERVSDKIAQFGGSWVFILSFCGFLALWVVLNTVLWVVRPPDPYPFIFLNLLLSCLAALQAPVIMMSQNRQVARDRRQAQEDYKINLKAELEIRHLHEKVDHLLHHHSQRLLEIQQIQTDLLRQIVSSRRDSGPGAGT
jgi:uncharacterized membrane protein